MNDQSQIMNQPQPMLNQPSQVPIMSQPPPQLLNQNPPMMSHHPQMMMNHPQAQSQIMNQQRSYGVWPPQARKDMNYSMGQQGFIGPKPRNWKGKKGNDKRKQDGSRRMDNKPLLGGGTGSSSGAGYRPPTLNELQHQNRMKARRFFNPKKKFNNRFAPYAPRNTTSFLIRAKKSGGIASLVSPCPVTPAVLPTPIFSPSREVLGDMAKEEWGVDGYGSMKGLIRLRSPGIEADAQEDEEEEEGGSSDSDVEEHVEVERRLDHDLSRFEMIYPSYGAGDYNNVLENRVDDQDTHIAQLEEENLILKERLFLMEREMGDLRRRLQYLERHSHVGEEINEEVVDNVTENDTESRDDGRSTDGHHEDNREEDEEVDGKERHSYDAPVDNCIREGCMDGFVHGHEVFSENRSKVEGVEDSSVEKSIGVNNNVPIEDLTNVVHDVSSGNPSKDEGMENCSVTKSTGINDDVLMDNITHMQLEVTKENDQSKIVEVGRGC